MGYRKNKEITGVGQKTAGERGVREPQIKVLIIREGGGRETQDTSRKNKANLIEKRDRNAIKALAQRAARL